MAEGKEIKLNEDAFDVAISKLTEYKNVLVGTKENFISVDENMKKDWIGDGGSAFILSANVLEASFAERINDLEEEAKALDNAKQSLFGEDQYLAKAIESAVSVAEAAVKVSEANKSSS